METTQHGWKVLDRDAGVLVREYTFDTPPGYANSFAVRIGDGMLLASPSVDPTDGVVGDLETFGPVKAILAENGFHYLGQAAWHKRFPEVRKFSPPLAVERIRDKFATPDDLPQFEPVDNLHELLSDNVKVFEMPGMKMGECWLTVDTAKGRILFTSDMIANMDRIDSMMMRMMMWMMRSYPGFRFNRGAAMMMVGDKPAAKQAMLDALEGPAPYMVVCGHGPIVEGGDLQARCRDFVNGAL